MSDYNFSYSFSWNEQWPTNTGNCWINSDREIYLLDAIDRIVDQQESYPDAERLINSILNTEG